MATVRLGGANIPLPTFPGLNNQVAAVGTPGQSGYYTGRSNALSLLPGETFVIPPGTWWVKTGPYTFLQWLDPVTNTWKVRPTAKETTDYVESDGVNWRLANTTGCVMGAVITTGGATYTNGIGSTATGVTVTASSGGSTWVPVVGGAIGATLATSTGTTTAGSGYTYPPICVIDAPPTGGLQATALVTALSSGTIPVANVQVTNQGAGYTTAPTLTFINDPRDTTGSGAVVVLALTATGQLTGLYPSNHGTALTGVPTLTITTATTTAQATALMNFTVTAFALSSSTTQGASLAAATFITTSNAYTGTANFITNPLHTTGLTFPRPARITANISSAVITTTGQVVEDGGLGIQQVPSELILFSVTSTTGQVIGVAGTPTVGGVNDTSFIQAV